MKKKHLFKRLYIVDGLLYPSASAISCNVLPVWWSGEGREGRQRDKTRHAEEGQAQRDEKGYTFHAPTWASTAVLGRCSE